MIALAIDENFDHHILRALLRRIPQLDSRTVQEAGLSGAEDALVLEWAAREQRVLVTHDVRTMTAAAAELEATYDMDPVGYLDPSVQNALAAIVQAQNEQMKSYEVKAPFGRPPAPKK